MPEAGTYTESKEDLMTDSQINSLSLAKDMIAIDPKSLTPDDIAQLQRLVLDYSAVAMCGSVQPWGRKLRDWAQNQQTTGKARLIGSGELANAATAALANGTSAHGYELDDTHEASNSHPGAVVISAALATAAATGAQGRDVLAAIAAGYETIARIGRASTSPEVTERGFHATCLFGPFGAATAVAKLKGLDADALTRAWGLALSMAGGAQQFAHESQGTMIKRMHAGLPAMHGVLAADLSALGVTAPAKPLEGPLGFFHLYSRNVQSQHLKRASGALLQIHSVSFKPYSCCRKFHSMIDALEIATDGFSIDPDRIQKIDAFSPGNAIKKHAIRRPDSVMAAQYSMPYIVAATLSKGPRDYGAYEAEFHNDPQILSLIDKTEAHHDPALDAHLPEKMAGGVVLHLDDGSVRQAEVIEALGSPGNSLSFEEILNKARAVTALIGPSIDVNAIATAVRRLPAMDDIDELTQLLAVPGYDAGRAAAAE
jgi:2-methylcitrate dehydratase PrpD